MSKVIVYNSPPPTAKQYSFAKSIAEKLNISMPTVEDYSVEGFKAFISKYSNKFYELNHKEKEAARMLNLISSMEEYEKEFGITI